MGRLAIAEAFVGRARLAETEETLHALLAEYCEMTGIQWFALVQHVDFSFNRTTGIRLHNYPRVWESWFDQNDLNSNDPVHRACHRTHIGFPWSAVPTMIRMTAADRSVLSQAKIVGIGDGFTVPAHVPGEMHGSCSFAVGPGETFPEELHAVAQLVGGSAFEAARRLTRLHATWPPSLSSLTGRQRDCVLWAARGKTDWEIAKILGISRETVIQHLKQARERTGVHRRAMLAVRALYEGLIGFTDIF